MACRHGDLVLAACKTLGPPASKQGHGCVFVRPLQRLQKHRYLCTRSRTASADQLVIFAAFVCMNKPYTVTVCSTCKAVCHSVQHQ